MPKDRSRNNCQFCFAPHPTSPHWGEETPDSYFSNGPKCSSPSIISLYHATSYPIFARSRCFGQSQNVILPEASQTSPTLITCIGRRRPRWRCNVKISRKERLSWRRPELRRAISSYSVGNEAAWAASAWADEMSARADRDLYRAGQRARGGSGGPRDLAAAKMSLPPSVTERI